MNKEMVINFLTDKNAITNFVFTPIGLSLIGITIIIWLLLIREIRCWYWKVNETTIILRGIRENGEKIDEKLAFIVNSIKEQKSFTEKPLKNKNSI